MYRRAIVLAFLPAALEVLAYSLLKSSSSETCFQFHFWCQFQLSSSFSSSFKFLFSIIVCVYRRYEYVCMACVCVCVCMCSVVSSTVFHVILVIVGILNLLGFRVVEKCAPRDQTTWKRWSKGKIRCSLVSSWNISRLNSNAICLTPRICFWCSW